MKTAVMPARAYEPGKKGDMTKDVYDLPYYGAWYKELETDGEKRRVTLYTPACARAQMRKTFIWMPEGVSADEFLARSCWADISETIGTYLILLESAGMCPGGERRYLYEAEKRCFFDEKEPFAPVTGDGNYIVGYGAGADAALECALNDPSKFSAAAFFGAKKTDSERLQEIGTSPLRAFAQDTRVEGYVNECCALPAWVFGKEDEDLISYLRRINSAQEDGETTQYGRVYREKPFVYNDTLNTRAMGRVIVTAADNAAEMYRDDGVTRRLWDVLFGKVLRFVEGPCGALRPFVPIEEPVFRMYAEKMPHGDFENEVTRRWCAYIPAGYVPGKPVPLVIATHGYTATYEYFARNSEWWRVAEEHGFIVAFTQALPTQGLNGTPRWRSGYLGKGRGGRPRDSREGFMSEIAYFRRVVERMKADYSIDPARVYCTGHSNGGAMTYDISECMKDVFAACVQAGACVWQETEEREDDRKMPALNIENGYDRFTDPFDEESPLRHELLFRMAENGIEKDSRAFMSDDGVVKRLEYHDANGLPIVQYAMYRNACHAYFPAISRIAWEFLKDWSRDEKGQVYYMGVPAGE